MIHAILNYSFMQKALMAAVLASILCGIIGAVIVEKRLVSMSGGIAHTSFGGIGLGYLLNVPPIVTGMIFAVIASISLPVIKRKTNTASDTLIGIFWATGMALGILFIGLTPGYPPDMTSYLFGDILTVSTLYLILLSVLSIIVLIVFISMFNYWKAYLFDETYLHVIGVKTSFFERILYVLIALSIVLLIKVVGIILAIALLTIPSAIAKLYTKQLKVMMIASTLISLVTSIGGLVLSYYFNIPSGATIILLAVVIYFGSYILKKLIR
ncbi:MAG: metal ABC transporter permease [Clostridiales bacterium]|nr:metal ABC transporter permease [Clostridiales bacterium]